MQNDYAHLHKTADGTQCCGGCSSAGQKTAAGDDDTAKIPLHAAAGQVVNRLHIQQMDCPVEEQLIRKKLATLSGVHGMEFNLVQRVLTVVHDEVVLQNIVTAIRELGMDSIVQQQQQEITETAVSGTPSGWQRLLVAGMLAALAETSHYLGYSDWLTALPALASIVLCGMQTYRKGWIALRHGMLNINALMSIAVTGAVLIGQWPEAAMVMVLFNLAEWLEARSLARARNAIRDTLDLSPLTVSRRTVSGDWEDVTAAQLVIGDSVRVRPGERIGADGTISSGHSALDQSAITGESMPVEKQTGDTVFAGTLNTYGGFEYHVTAAAQNTMLARIIHTVEEAQGSRAPTQRFIDRFSQWYTPAVVLMAVVTAFVLPLLELRTWLEAVYMALTLLIIACPCALVISTPVAIVSALTAASRRGLLIKGGACLENGYKLVWLGLDKTGTLTSGHPRCVDEHTLATTSDPATAIVSTLFSLAAGSDHPASKAVTQWAKNQSGAEDITVNDFRALPGQGVSGVIDGRRYFLGSPALMAAENVDCEPMQDDLQVWKQQGKTVIALGSDGRLLWYGALADSIRAESIQAISDLHAQGVRTLLLSGDHNGAVGQVAQQVGIDEVYAELMPEEKLAHLRQKQQQGQWVGMVGDGINDAPALAAADIGFAMGVAGSGVALETADVALMDDDLRKVGQFIRLSAATHQVLVQNIIFALGVKLLFLLLALGGFATLWMAVFADVGTSLLVVANSMRLLRTAEPTKPDKQEPPAVAHGQG